MQKLMAKGLGKGKKKIFRDRNGSGKEEGKGEVIRANEGGRVKEY